jgi:hypothetical protein
LSSLSYTDSSPPYLSPSLPTLQALST